LEKYFEAFKKEKCIDIRDAQYLDDEQMLKDVIGIKTVIERKRFVGECKKLKIEMNAFDALNLNDALHRKLHEMGIITLRILTSEVTERRDLNRKLGFNDNEEIDRLWDIIQNGKKRSTQIADGVVEEEEAEGMEQEGVANVGGNVVDTLHGYRIPMSVPYAASVTTKAFNGGLTSFDLRGKSTPYM